MREGRRRAYRLMEASGDRGITWGELAVALETHHGPASGVLSSLHREGKIARLAQTRGGSKIYVLPGHVAGRDTEKYGRRRTHDIEDLAVTKVRAARVQVGLRELVEARVPASTTQLKKLLAILEGTE